jgi:hypothetical protein
MVGMFSRLGTTAGGGAILLGLDFMEDNQSPNKSPEPTAVGAGRSAIAVHVASRRWLSFLR